LEKNDLISLTKNSVPVGKNVAGDEGKHPAFLCLDFAVCRDEEGKFFPRMIELQGVASLFAYQHFLSQAYQKHFSLPEPLTPYWNGLTGETYLKRFGEFLLGGQDPETVAMLDLDPPAQKTRIDFDYTQKTFGIKPLCIKDLLLEKGKLAYESNGRIVPISRIYNRVIPDEFEQKRENFHLKFDYYAPPSGTDWLSHPNWFYRVSKYLMPFMDSPYVPKTHFLHELDELPDDLENWVLKPLFSFAGAGVVFDVTRKDIDLVPLERRHEYILQQKVNYAAFVPTLDVPAKSEMRILCIWGKNGIEPLLNLARLSKGKILGVDFNKDKRWVGSSAIFWE
jgi:hypothetical protein